MQAQTHRSEVKWFHIQKDMAKNAQFKKITFFTILDVFLGVFLRLLQVFFPYVYPLKYSLTQV